MLNGTRRRDDDDDHAKSDFKRVQQGQQDQPLNHYDIYAIPSFVPPSPLLQSSSTHFQSASLVIVNRSAGLSTGLGISIFLTSSTSSPHLLTTHTNPGFSLAREPSFDASKAILLGWVEEERLMELEEMVRRCEVPAVHNPPRGGEALEWLMGVGRKLEYEGFLSNPEILLSDVLQRR
ncbi:hypothetical protein JCM8547_009254 [Rhodosporidiobolus lusitaniae]